MKGNGCWADLRSALEFLTPIGHATRRPSGAAMAWFPLAGALIGAAEGMFWRATTARLGRLPAAAATVAFDVALTGCLHLDGLADTADGCLVHVPARDRLRIMESPEVGAFGVTALSMSLLLRTAALSSGAPSVGLLSALCGASRSLMGASTRLVPYARDHGIVTPFLSVAPGGDAVVPSSVIGIAGAVLLAATTAGRRGGLAVLAGVIAGSVVITGARRRLGGYTGDVLGAAGVACETVGLLAATWRQ